MALKQPYMVKTGIDVDYLTLRADPGKAFLVKEIGSNNTDPAEFTKVTIDRVTLAYLMTYDGHCNQFWFSHIEKTPLQLMRYLYEMGIFPGFPIAEGQEMRIEPEGATGKNIKIIYEIHDPEDITPEMSCGTNCKEYVFWNYGTNSLEVATEASTLIDKCLTPKEFPDFPFGAVVPAKTQIELLAMLLGNRRLGEPSFDYVNWLKLLRGREVLFDEERVGIWAKYSETDFPFHRSDAVIRPFPEPLLFMPGDELNLQVTLGDTLPWEADQGLICFVEKVTKLE